jgi:heat shock protein HslJ
MTKHRCLGLLLIIILAGISLTACNSTQTDLTGPDWVLESYGPADALKPVITTTKVTARIDLKTGQISGSGGCNHYGAKIKVTGNRLSVSNLSSTAMGCLAEGVGDQETAFLKLLQDAADYQINNHKLTINCGSGILVFKAQ